MAMCPRCESTDVVEVDNPLRREVRHRRGVTCPGRPPELPPGAADLFKRARPLTATEFDARKFPRFTAETDQEPIEEMTMTNATPLPIVAVEAARALRTIEKEGVLDVSRYPALQALLDAEAADVSGL